ncbi:hypothetical protein HDU98_011841, partial [Podochytrium sp. JEL0797]
MSSSGPLLDFSCFDTIGSSLDQSEGERFAAQVGPSPEVLLAALEKQQQRENEASSAPSLAAVIAHDLGLSMGADHGNTPSGSTAQALGPAASPLVTTDTATTTTPTTPTPDKKRGLFGAFMRKNSVPGTAPLLVRLKSRSAQDPPIGESGATPEPPSPHRIESVTKAFSSLWAKPGSPVPDSAASDSPKSAFSTFMSRSSLKHTTEPETTATPPSPPQTATPTPIDPPTTLKKPRSKSASRSGTLKRETSVSESSADPKEPFDASARTPSLKRKTTKRKNSATSIKSAASKLPEPPVIPSL